MSSKKENVGQDIWKALLLLNENKNLEEAEKYIQNFCGKPLTEYVGKPVAESRNEALFRIYLTEKTRRLLSPKSKTAIEDYAGNFSPNTTARSRGRMRTSLSGSLVAAKTIT